MLPIYTSMIHSAGRVRSMAFLPIAVAMIGCTRLAGGSLTGTVEEIVIEDGLSATEVNVRPGDEIRLINRHGGPVHVVFLDQIDERVTCTRGFGLVRVANGKQLKPNQSISLCFGTPGTVRYTVRLDRATTTGAINVPGTIRIEGSVADGKDGGKGGDSRTRLPL